MLFWAYAKTDIDAVSSTFKILEGKIKERALSMTDSDKDLLVKTYSTGTQKSVPSFLELLG